MKLSVIIPVWNETATLQEILRLVETVAVEKEIIIVDDFSTDGTREQLQALIGEGRAFDASDDIHQSNSDSANFDSAAFDSANSASRGTAQKIAIVFQTQHGGKGTSVRQGLKRARGEWVVVQDADLEYDPQDLLKLLAFAEKKGRRCSAVFGTRLLKGSPSRANQAANSRTAFYYGRIGLSVWFRVLYGAPVSDVATCYKMVKREVLQNLKLQGCGFELDFEIAAKLIRHGHRIWEVPVFYAPRSVFEGKKIRAVQDGLRAAWTLLKLRFSSTR